LVTSPRDLWAAPQRTGLRRIPSTSLARARMMNTANTNRPLWASATILAVAVFAGTGAAVAPLRQYLVARYGGEGADLHGCTLPLAPLSGVNLAGANLNHATLCAAKLRGA